MTILHLDAGQELRGGQRQVLLLLGELQAHGHACVLLARAGSPLAKAASDRGFEVVPLGLRELWRQSRTVDVVHSHDARAHTMAALASQTRFVVSRRVGFPIQQNFLSTLKYRRASRYLAISHFVAAQLCKAGVPSGRVDVVFDGVETVNPSSWDRANPVVAPAFHNDPKKLSNLTEQACRMAGVPLVLSDNLTRDLRAASAFVYLSESEGFGSAALLAMAAGVPVIASRVEGLAEVFEHEQSGVYVDNSAPAVSAAIHRILDEPGFACRLRDAALVRVQSLFSSAQMMKATVASYERALGG